MKKWISLALLLILLVNLGACSNAVPEKGDFRFALPAGYSLSDQTDLSCSIVRDSDGEAVGGFALTDLTVRQLKKGQYYTYLDHSVPAVNGCEFFSWEGGSGNHPISYVNLQFTDAETGVGRQFLKVLFVKERGVYDMWFDLEKIDAGAAERFYPIAEQKQ